MDRTLIIYPAFAVVILTFITMIKMRLLSEKHLKSGELKFKYFKVYDGSVPEDLEQARQHYKNYFEIPVLFYLLLIFIYATDNVNQYDVILAWLFVFFKGTHSYIRMTNNYVPNRAKAFILALIVLLFGWINFIIKL